MTAVIVYESMYGSTRAVALHAVDPECRPPAGDCRAHQFAVFRQTLDRNLRESGHERSPALGLLSHLLRKLPPAAPAEHAFGCLVYQRPSRIKNNVNDPPDDRQIERPEPPPRHRRIEFLDAIPFVPDGPSSRRLIERLSLRLLSRHRTRP